MPELAEVALMAVEVNRHSHHIFHAVARSSIAKLGPDLPLPRCWRTFRLEARSRGKEMRLDVWPVRIDAKLRKQEEKERQQAAHSRTDSEEQEEKEDEGEDEEVETTPQRKRKRKQPLNGRGKPFTRIHPDSPATPLDGPLPLLFRMGMTGHIQSFPSHNATHKHAHLTFLSSEPSEVSVCFVDQRQFGRWLVTDQWDRTRGPCPLTEYDLFRQHVLDSLEQRAMEKPLCEVMLDQKYFNGIGNYLRAEICHRADVNPFASGRNVLSRLVGVEDSVEEPDVLRLCHDVPEEVFSLGYRYGSMNNEEAVRQQIEAEAKAEAEAQREREAEAEEDEKTQSTRVRVPPTKQSRKSFSQWLRCYEKHGDGMLSTVDGLGRAMWHNSRWRVAGKSKAGSRRPRKGKTISGADREEGDTAAAQTKSAEAATSRAKKSSKSKQPSKKVKARRVKRDDVDVDEQEAKAASSDKRARGVKRAQSAIEADSPAATRRNKTKRSATSSAAGVDDSGEEAAVQQTEHNVRRRSSRLSSLPAHDDKQHTTKRAKGQQAADDNRAAAGEKENVVRKAAASKKRARKEAPAHRARGLKQHNGQ